MQATRNLKIEGVRAYGKRSIAYWRYRPADETDEGRPATPWFAAISRLTANNRTAFRDADTAAWRVLGYDPDRKPPNGNQELGDYPTRAAAETAVREYIAGLLAAPRPGRGRCSPGRAETPHTAPDPHGGGTPQTDADMANASRVADAARLQAHPEDEAI